MSTSNSIAQALWAAIDSHTAAATALSFGVGVMLALCLGQPFFLLVTAGVAAVVSLLFFPEIALALYVVVGDVKGDERVAALLPFDWTIALGIVITAGIVLHVLRGKRIAPMPSAYLSLLLLVGWMSVSLAYTPVYGGGLDKLGRFLTVTGIVIVTPFFALTTPKAMKRFITAFGVVAFAICCYALLGLGDSGRLVSPSDNTIGLGHVACALVLLIWFGLICTSRGPVRLASYLLLIVPAVALAGSGSRGSVIACVAAIAIGLCFYRQTLWDLALFAITGCVAMPLFQIPQSSIDYLATLVKSGSVEALLDFRGDLLGLGWKLLQQHPLAGVGIGGFQYSSANPTVYKWPHNIFLEAACELGIPAALLMFAFFGIAVREAIRQMRQASPRLRMFSSLGGAWLLLGLINGLNTGDINSDRTTWLFVSLVFVIGTYEAEKRTGTVQTAFGALGSVPA